MKKIVYLAPLALLGLGAKASADKAPTHISNALRVYEQENQNARISQVTHISRLDSGLINDKDSLVGNGETSANRQVSTSAMQTMSINPTQHPYHVNEEKTAIDSHLEIDQPINNQVVINYVDELGKTILGLANTTIDVTKGSGSYQIPVNYQLAGNGGYTVNQSGKIYTGESGQFEIAFDHQKQPWLHEGRNPNDGTNMVYSPHSYDGVIWDRGDGKHAAKMAYRIASETPDAKNNWQGDFNGLTQQQMHYYFDGMGSRKFKFNTIKYQFVDDSGCASLTHSNVINLKLKHSTKIVDNNSAILNSNATLHSYAINGDAAKASSSVKFHTTGLLDLVTNVIVPTDNWYVVGNSNFTSNFGSNLTGFTSLNSNLSALTL